VIDAGLRKRGNLRWLKFMQLNGNRYLLKTHYN